MGNYFWKKKKKQIKELRDIVNKTQVSINEIHSLIQKNNQSIDKINSSLNKLNKLVSRNHQSINRNNRMNRYITFLYYQSMEKKGPQYIKNLEKMTFENYYNECKEDSNIIV